MKLQNTTTPIPKNSLGYVDEKNNVRVPSRFRLKSFFEAIFPSPTTLSCEDWERLELRRSPQSIRADARRDGIL
jgi:hypothetical protein